MVGSAQFGYGRQIRQAEGRVSRAFHDNDAGVGPDGGGEGVDVGLLYQGAFNLSAA